MSFNNILLQPTRLLDCSKWWIEKTFLHPLTFSSSIFVRAMAEIQRFAPCWGSFSFLWVDSQAVRQQQRATSSWLIMVSKTKNPAELDIWGIYYILSGDWWLIKTPDVFTSICTMDCLWCKFHTLYMSLYSPLWEMNMVSNSQFWGIRKPSCNCLMVGMPKWPFTYEMFVGKERLCNQHKEHLHRRLGDTQMKII